MELYFDNAATTPLLPHVQDVIKERMATFGNPSSLHRKGVEAEEVVSHARRQVLRMMGAAGGTVVFTGSGTEANNLALLGTARMLSGRGRHVVTTAVEHPSVLEPLRALERQGYEVTYVRPQPDGCVAAEDVLAAVRDDTVLVSVMHVNNETGARMPVEQIGRALADHPKVRFHVDGIQAFGKIPHPVREARADLYTVSGHKLGAPKGIGALYLREGVRVEPVVYGGGQEFGLRSGTENVLGIAAFSAAVAVMSDGIQAAWEHVSALNQQLVAGLREIPGCELHLPQERSPYIVNVSFPGLKGEVLVHALESKGLFVSTGSACSSKGGHAIKSHVLVAMGMSEQAVQGAIRLSLTRWATSEEVARALDVIREQTRWLRSIL
ncbi:cysteine desulfurase family protein [Alicyclobacillus shizuokensis]|uniref:cysteine desulfurase family protein n=1 Tax=Alicyclobacillus shizuokensis TaxID=392014 RepID=UPI0008300CEE|nr:cysteine desulfurase family protein [Alicyclobacillus shizuokensis]MCL6627573.1 cysteine desulfurase [Alicyclobacillus shizuokensis]